MLWLEQYMLISEKVLPHVYWIAFHKVTFLFMTLYFALGNGFYSILMSIIDVSGYS